MAPRIRMLKAKQIEKVLFQLGFSKVRQKGSHRFYKHPDGRCTVVPFHGREEIGRGLLRQIMREIQISMDEFIQLL